MRTAIAIAAALAVAGCGTKFGASLGDMTYYHKPRCDKPAKEWVEEGYAPVAGPSKKRVGGMMMRGGAVPVEGHWHYHC